MTLKRRTLTSMVWTSSAIGVVFFVSLVRSVLLARLLPIDVFGVYAFAAAVVELTAVLSMFGLADAFLYRGPETEDEDEAAAVHFTLSSIFSVIWAFLLVAGAVILADGTLRLALLVLTASRVGQQCTLTPRVLLIRRVTHGRLASLQIVSALATAVVAVYLAWRGFGIRALLAVNIVTTFLTIFALYLWQPVWRPRFLWKRPIVRYFLRSGGQNLLAQALNQALARIDKLWIGWFMNDVTLGFYSRAYAYSSVAVSSLSRSVSTVAGGTYAELADDRARLSRAVSRVTGWILRAGLPTAGVLWLTGPELVTLLIGARWLPMVPAFRILLFAFVCTATSRGLSQLFIAVGKPWTLVQIRALQVLTLVLGLWVLAPQLGLVGAAASFSAAALVGLAVLLWAVHSHADVSLRRLFLVPSLALLGALAFGVLSDQRLDGATSEWVSALVKGAVALTVYLLVLFVFERSEVEDGWKAFRESFDSTGAPESSSSVDVL